MVKNNKIVKKAVLMKGGMFFVRLKEESVVNKYECTPSTKAIFSTDVNQALLFGNVNIAEIFNDKNKLGCVVLDVNVSIKPKIEAPVKELTATDIVEQITGIIEDTGIPFRVIDKLAGLTQKQGIDSRAGRPLPIDKHNKLVNVLDDLNKLIRLDKKARRDEEGLLPWNSENKDF